MTEKSYTLREIHPDLWRKVKIKCAAEDRPIKRVILELLQAWVNEP